MLRQRIEGEDGGARQEVHLADPGNGRDPRATTHVKKDPRRAEDLIADANRARRLEAGVALDEAAAAHPGEPRLQAVLRLRHDGIRPGLDPAHVDAHRAPHDDAVLGSLTRDVGGPGAGDHRLGGRAADVDARAADELSLDHRDGHARGRESPRQRRPSLAGADDDRVEKSSLGSPPQSMSCCPPSTS